jgi:TolB-like protein
MTAVHADDKGRSCRRLFVLLVMILAGCATPPRPPAYSLYEHRRLSVLAFDNYSMDPSLAREIQDAIIADLVDLNAVPVSEGHQVQMCIGDQNVSQMMPEQLAVLARKLNSDVIMVGAVQSYTESLDASAPERRTGDHDDHWGYYRKHRIKFNVTVKLVDAVSGRPLWAKRVKSKRANREWLDLPDRNADHETREQTAAAMSQAAPDASASGNGADADAPLLYEVDAALAELRQEAIHKAVQAITRDFKGRGGWTPVTQPIASSQSTSETW